MYMCLVWFAKDNSKRRPASSPGKPKKLLPRTLQTIACGARTDPDTCVHMWTDEFGGGHPRQKNCRFRCNSLVCSFCPRAVLRSQSSGRTVVIAAVEGHVAGLFGLVDTLRPEAKGVISELTRMGLEVRMYAYRRKTGLRTCSFGLDFFANKVV